MSRSGFLRFAESFYRRWWLFLIPILVGIAAGVVYFFVAPTKYTAKGTLYVQMDTYLSEITNLKQDTGPTYVTPAKQTSDEINDLLLTDAFIRAMIQQTPLEAKMSGSQTSVDTLIDTVRRNVFTLEQGTYQVTVSATWEEDPQVATSLANSVIDNYIRWKTNTQRTDTQTAVEFLAGVIAQYQNTLDRARLSLQDYLNAHPAPLRGERSGTEQVEIDTLQKQIDIASTRLNDALDKSEAARLSADTMDGSTRGLYTIIDSPRVAKSGITSRTSKALISSIFAGVGLLISAGAVFANFLFDKSFTLPADVTERTGLPVLAVFPDEKYLLKQQKKADRAQSKKKKPVSSPVSAD